MENLYTNLTNLVNDEDSPFYRVVHTGAFDGAEYHVFSYRLGSYQDFCQTDALECRGTMFRIDEDGPVLVSLPFFKFFNLGENPFTIGLDLSADNIDYVTSKEDGSLISTYLNAHSMLLCKSKTSLTSTMAEDAAKLIREINRPTAQQSLYELCLQLEIEGYTVIMEFVAPHNRIVLPYEYADLVVLGVRNRGNGELMPFEEMIDRGMEPYLVENHTEMIENFDDFFEDFREMKGIEGFVVRLKDGTILKLKTDEYVALHHAKDSVTAPRRLMEVVLAEASDDLRQMFEDDEQALREIEHMEIYVSHIVAHMTKPVDTFYDTNKDLERKEYAIKGQQELDRRQFAIAMGRYSGKDIDYKTLIQKNHQEFLRDYVTTLVVDEVEESD